MLLVVHLAPKNPHDHGSQLLWAAPAYHKKEGASPHPGAWKFSLLYVGRPNERFEVRVEMWNLGSVSVKGG